MYCNCIPHNERNNSPRTLEEGSEHVCTYEMRSCQTRAALDVEFIFRDALFVPKRRLHVGWSSPIPGWEQYVIAGWEKHFERNIVTTLRTMEYLMCSLIAIQLSCGCDPCEVTHLPSLALIVSQQIRVGHMLLNHQCNVYADFIADNIRANVKCIHMT